MAPDWKPVTVAEFDTWLMRAIPGDRFEYHRGFLASDRVLDQVNVKPHEREILSKTGSYVWMMHEKGLVTLAQQKIAPNEFSYVAVRLKPEAAERAARKAAEQARYTPRKALAA